MYSSWELSIRSDPNANMGTDLPAVPSERPVALTDPDPCRVSRVCATPCRISSWVSSVAAFS